MLDKLVTSSINREDGRSRTSGVELKRVPGESKGDDMGFSSVVCLVVPLCEGKRG